MTVASEVEGKSHFPTAANPQSEAQAINARFHLWAGQLAAAASEDDRNQLLLEGVQLVKARRAAMTELIRKDPAQALTLAVTQEKRKNLPTAVTDELEVQVSGIGDFIVLTAMSAKGGAREMMHRFVRLDGVTYGASVYGRRTAQTSKRNIPLHGILLDGVVAVHESVLRELGQGETPDRPLIEIPSSGGKNAHGERVIVEMGGRFYRFASRAQFKQHEQSLEASESGLGPNVTEAGAILAADGGDTGGGGSGPTLDQGWTTGAKKVLYIRVDFSDKPGAPFGYSEMLGMVDSQISSFYLRSSYGLTTMTNTVTTNVYRMPQTASYYATAGNYIQMHNDATGVASQHYNMSEYDRIMVVFANLSGLIGSQMQWAGMAMIGGRESWCNGHFDFNIVSHELGHNCGLFHANLWLVSDGNPTSPGGVEVEYGDALDVMGENYFNSSRADFNPWFKSMLGWIAPAQVVDASSNGTYRIHAFDHDNYQAAVGEPLAIKVEVDGVRNFWIGARRNITNNPTLTNGVYVIWGYNYNRTSVLLDMATPGYSEWDCGLQVGSNFLDSTTGIILKSLAKGGTPPNEYYDVQVTFGPPVITGQPTNQMVVAGDPAAFSITAFGRPTPAYQWRRQPVGGGVWSDLADGGGISGATNSELHINATTLGMNGDAFQCVAYNANGAATSSPPAILTVASGLVLTTEPVDQAIRLGATAQFAVAASGDPPLTYAWQRQTSGSGSWIDLSDLDEVTGCSTTNLSLMASDIAMNGDQFRCRVSTALGMITNTRAATLSVNSGLMITTIVGQNDTCGSANGTGTNALLCRPYDVATGPNGNLYVADSFNNVLRKVTPERVVTTLGSGFTDTRGLAVDARTNIYVADGFANAIMKVTPAGVVTTIAGSTTFASGTNDGMGTSARFNEPWGIAVDAKTNLYVADSSNHTIRRIAPSGSSWIVTTIAGSPGSSGSDDGTNSQARFNQPAGLDLDVAGNIYVADYGNHTIRKVTFDTNSAKWVVTTIAGAAGMANATDGSGSNARFAHPIGIAASSSGDVFIGDTGNSLIRRINPQGVVSTLAGTRWSIDVADGYFGDARFRTPYGIAVDKSGNIYVADYFNNTVRMGTFARVLNPKLLIAHFNRTNTLAWQEGMGNYVLQSSTNLENSNWTEVAKFPQILNGTNFTSIPATNAQTFYRLHQH